MKKLKTKSSNSGVTATQKAKKPTLSQSYDTLRATIREYFSQLRYRQPEYSIKLAASVAGEGGAQKVHMVNVPSLIASVVTAQGLGKEIKIKAVQDPTGGALIIEFYAPVTVGDKVTLLS